MEIYMLSNLYYSYGAAAIALPQVQAWMYMKFKCNLLIQLWNIHHVVVIPENTLPLDVSDQVLADRKKNWKPTAPTVTTGYLARYANMVTSGNTGAILKQEF